MLRGKRARASRHGALGLSPFPAVRFQEQKMLEAIKPIPICACPWPKDDLCTSPPLKCGACMNTLLQNVCQAEKHVPRAFCDQLVVQMTKERAVMDTALRALYKQWGDLHGASMAICGEAKCCTNGAGSGGETATDPPVTDPPVTDPPVTDPPVTDPPVTDPPIPTPPPVTDPPEPPSPCEDNCNGNGECIDGICKCSPLWVGDACQSGPMVPGKCKSVGDPHPETFGKQKFNIYEKGEWSLVKHPDMKEEMRAYTDWLSQKNRPKPQGGTAKTIAANVGFAHKSVDGEILVVTCVGKNALAAHVGCDVVEKESPQGTRVEGHNTHELKLFFKSGTEVKIATWGNWDAMGRMFLNIFVNMHHVNDGKGTGICGTMGGNDDAYLNPHCERHTPCDYNILRPQQPKEEGPNGGPQGGNAPEMDQLVKMGLAMAGEGGSSKGLGGSDEKEQSFFKGCPSYKLEKWPDEKASSEGPHSLLEVAEPMTVAEATDKCIDIPYAAARADCIEDLQVAGGSPGMVKTLVEAAAKSAVDMAKQDAELEALAKKQKQADQALRKKLARQHVAKHRYPMYDTGFTVYVRSDCPRCEAIQHTYGSALKYVQCDEFLKRGEAELFATFINQFSQGLKPRTFPMIFKNAKFIGYDMVETPDEVADDETMERPPIDKDMLKPATPVIPRNFTVHKIHRL